MEFYENSKKMVAGTNDDYNFYIWFVITFFKNITIGTIVVSVVLGYIRRFVTCSKEISLSVNTFHEQFFVPQSCFLSLTADFPV